MIKKLLARPAVVAGLIVAILMTGTFTYALGKKEKQKQIEAKGFLGVTIERLNSDDKEELKADFGVMITKVMKDKAADKAGLKRYDVIQYVDGEKIRRPGDLSEEISAHKPDSKVKIKLIRDGKSMEVAVKLGKRKVHKHSYFFPGKDKKGNFTIKKFKRAYLGVTLMELNKDLAWYFGVKPKQGVLVTKVSKKSPAEKAGIKSGDVILKVEGKKVTESKDIIKVIGDMEEGNKVNLVVMRQKKEVKVNAELDERKLFGNFRVFTSEDGDYSFKHGNVHVEAPRIRIKRGYWSDDGHHIIIDSDKKFHILEKEMKNLKKIKELKKLKEHQKKKVRKILEHKDHTTI